MQMSEMVAMDAHLDGSNVSCAARKDIEKAEKKSLPQTSTHPLVLKSKVDKTNKATSRCGPSHVPRQGSYVSMPLLAHVALPNRTALSQVVYIIA